MIATFLTARGTEPICFGPFCETLKPLSEKAGNAVVPALIGSVLGKVIYLFITIAGIFVLMYLMWGALDWILSEGDKEKLAKAQKKMTNAIIGMLLIIISLTIFGMVTGDVLGIFKKTDNGWIFSIPTLVPVANP